MTNAGATMTLTLRNGSKEQIGYNLCTSAIETTSGKNIESGRVCTMEPRTVEPGRSAIPKNFPGSSTLEAIASSPRFTG